MAKITDMFNKLKISLLGSKTSGIDKDLDLLNKEITNYSSKTGQSGYIELMKSVLSKYSEFDSTVNQLIMPGVNPSPGTFGQSSRIYRYKTYISIISNIPYCYRALNVIGDNVLSPDNITKKSLEIKPILFTAEDNPETISKVDMVKEVIKTIKLEKYLDIILTNTLLFGDFFCEICDSKSALSTSSYLLESNFVNENTEKMGFSSFKKDITFSLDFSLLNESKKQSKINDIKLIFHDPSNVIKLQTDSFPLCLGYLVFPKLDHGKEYHGNEKSIDDICKDILKNVEKKIPAIKGLKNKKEIKDLISYIVNKTDPINAIKIRYIPDYRMQHFTASSSLKYYPYGESIFDSSQFLAKVLIALETAMTIQRLSRSTEKRKIAFEVGLPRDAKKAVEMLKEQIRKRKISLDSLGTLDTIPSMITTFEDIYVPQRDGRPFVDISTFSEGNVDVRSKTDELKFIRDSLLANLNVPPAFLGIEENVSLKSTLSEENVLFTRSIVKTQKHTSDEITECLKKIISIVNPQDSLSIFDYVSVAFPAPKSLQSELMSRHMNEIISLIESLERIGIPRDWAKKKYLPDIEWDEIEQFKVDKEIEKTMGTEKSEEEAGGMPSGGF